MPETDPDKIVIGTRDRIVYSCDELLSEADKRSKIVELATLFSLAPARVLILDGGKKLWVIQPPTE